jgi:hypothetical protein
MFLQENRTIALVASPTMEAAKLADKVADLVGNRDDISIEKLEIGPLMEAQLKGSAFEISTLTPVRQPVSGTASTTWEWNIRPNQTGTQTLHLTIDAIVTIAGERLPRSVSVFNRNIDVDVTAGQRIGMFIAGNWQWLTGTVLIPLAVWLWTFRRSSKRKRRK